MNKVSEIASKHLGKVGGEGYKDQYDPSLLVAIPRHLNREAYSIDGKNLPFTGVDVWNAYEVSVLTKKGLPVSGIMKITIPADSESHVESKSLKLYLNSFNMTKLGGTTERTATLLTETVIDDLSNLMNCDVNVQFYTSFSVVHSLLPSLPIAMKVGDTAATSLESLVDLDSIDFNTEFTGFSFYEKSERPFKMQYWKSDLLRSNCRVTNQPDWGDIYICMEGKNIPTAESIARYIVSHRTVSHFHEEICEMVFSTVLKECKLDNLMVACLYTRRGGIDINPIRSTTEEWIPTVFKNSTAIFPKSLRQ
jgi:7-cyano-7-deazaguanine reductase